jgi:hypothetical protein
LRLHIKRELVLQRMEEIPTVRDVVSRYMEDSLSQQEE